MKKYINLIFYQCRLIISILLCFALSFPAIAMEADEEDDIRGTMSNPLLSKRVGNYGSTPGSSNMAEEILIEDNQRKMLQWLESCIFGDRAEFSKCKKNTLLAIEIFSGSARGTVYFIVGYDLAMRLPIEEPYKLILSYTYGTCVFLPMAILGTSSSSRVFKKLLTRKLQVEKDIEREQPCEEKAANYTTQSVALIAGLLSAPPLTYLAYDKLDPLLGWGWVVPGVPTYYVRTLIDYDATIALVDRLRLSIKVRRDRAHANYDSSGMTLNRAALLTNIRDNYLNPARSYIKSLNFEQADRFTEEMKKQHSLGKISLLSHPQHIIPENEVKLQAEDHILKRLLSAIGGGIGIYGTGIFYPMAKDAWAPILNLLGIGPAENLETALAIISLASVSPVTYISSESSTNKFCSVMWNLSSSIYTACRSWYRTNREDEMMVSEEVKIRKEKAKSREKVLKYKRMGAALVSTVLATCFALSQTEIAEEFFDINQIEVKFNLAAQAMSTFSLVFWAVDEFLLNYLKAGDPRTPFLTKIDTINKKLEDMTEKSLRNLETYVQAPASEFIFNNSDNKIDEKEPSNDKSEIILLNKTLANHSSQIN